MATKTATKAPSKNGAGKTATTNRIASVVTVPQIEVVSLEIKLVGDSPLICHAWSDKAKKQMLDKQMKKAKTAKEAKVPAHNFVESMYWLTERPELPAGPDKAMAAATEAVAKGRFGFPSVAFKSCAVGGCRFADGMKMTEARGAFHVNGEFVEIEAGPPRMREDMVRVGMGTADIRYRGEFPEWSVTLNITLNRHAMSEAQVVNLLNLGGFGVGIGEWRPEKNGSNGRFHVE